MVPWQSVAYCLKQENTTVSNAASQINQGCGNAVADGDFDKSYFGGMMG